MGMLHFKRIDMELIIGSIVQVLSTAYGLLNNCLLYISYNRVIWVKFYKDNIRNKEQSKYLTSMVVFHDVVQDY